MNTPRTSVSAILIVLGGAIITVWIGGYVMGKIVSPYANQLNNDSGLKEGWRLIGYCERLLIYVFVLAGAPSAIGLLVTAKSLFRFGEATGKQKRRHAEYIIVGTLMSFAYAVTLSYLVRWILNIFS